MANTNFRELFPEGTKLQEDVFEAAVNTLIMHLSIAHNEGKNLMFVSSAFSEPIFDICTWDAETEKLTIEYDVEVNGKIQRRIDSYNLRIRK